MWPGTRPTSVPCSVLIHPAVWSQWTWAENWGGGSAPFLGRGSWSPCYTKSPGLRPTSIPRRHLNHPAIWTQQIWAVNWGLCPFGWAEVGPHLTQCDQGRGLPACQVSSWSMQLFGRNTAHQRHRQTDRRRSDKHCVKSTGYHYEFIVPALIIGTIKYSSICRLLTWTLWKVTAAYVPFSLVCRFLANVNHRSRIRYLSKKNSRILTNFPKLKKFVKNSLNARV